MFIKKSSLHYSWADSGCSEEADLGFVKGGFFISLQVQIMEATLTFVSHAQLCMWLVHEALDIEECGLQSCYVTKW